MYELSHNTVKSDYMIQVKRKCCSCHLTAVIEQLIMHMRTFFMFYCWIRLSGVIVVWLQGYITK